MTLKIISTEKILYSGNVDLVTLPGELGSFTVLNNHAPLISVLVKGRVIYKETETEKVEVLNVKGGLVDVDNNVISVCIY